MTWLQLYTDFKPQISMLATILVCYFAYLLLGDPIKDLLKTMGEEIRSLPINLISRKKSMLTINAWGMVLYFVMASGVLLNTTLAETVGFMRGERQTEGVELAKIGATCFLTFVFVVGLLLSIKLSNSAPDD
jgi:hypothetical protein